MPVCILGQFPQLPACRGYATYIDPARYRALTNHPRLLEFGFRSAFDGGLAVPVPCRELKVENQIFTEKVQVERKLFTIDLRENPRGRFLKITEDVGGRRDAVIIPATGLRLIRDALDRAITQQDTLAPTESTATE